MKYWVLLLGLFLGGCGFSNFADLRFEGEAQTKKLAEELKRIECKEDLQKALPAIKKRFNKIADLLVAAREIEAPELEPSFASEQLFVELARLYEMPGGRDLIETAQSEAVCRLRR